MRPMQRERLKAIRDYVPCPAMPDAGFFSASPTDRALLRAGMIETYDIVVPLDLVGMNVRYTLCRLTRKGRAAVVRRRRAMPPPADRDGMHLLRTAGRAASDH